MKKTITPQEKLQLLGLLTLARQHQKMVREAEGAMIKVLDHDDNYLDHLSDAMYDDSSIDDALKYMGVKVKGEK